MGRSKLELAREAIQFRKNTTWAYGTPPALLLARMLNASLKIFTSVHLGLATLLMGATLSVEAATIAISPSELVTTSADAHPVASRIAMNREARRFLREIRKGELFVWFLEGSTENDKFLLVEEMGEDGEMIRELLSIDTIPSFMEQPIQRDNLIIYEQLEVPMARALYDTIGLPESISLGLASLKFERGDLQIKAAVRLPPKDERGPNFSLLGDEGLRTELLWTEFSVNWKF